MPERIEFPASVKKIVAERAGLRCFVPSCGQITTGPGARDSQIARTGMAYHIHSAAEGGPRGRGGLSDAELQSAATSSSRWPRSRCRRNRSRTFYGSLPNYGRTHHQRQRETLDCHAFKSNRWEECAQMPGKMARSAPRPPFGLPEVLVAVLTSRLSCRKAGKTRTFTPIRESSGEIPARQGVPNPRDICGQQSGGLKSNNRKNSRYAPKPQAV
jgi:hypothetical protein